MLALVLVSLLICTVGILISNNKHLKNIEKTVPVQVEKIEKNVPVHSRYKMYHTENIYNLLILDTKTGRIEQVQWSLETDTEFSVEINNADLSKSGYGAGSFELYPTKNIYQFILIDTHDGRKWHVQWGIEDENRWIRPILN